jgi:hypothetical protein
MNRFLFFVAKATVHLIKNTTQPATVRCQVVDHHFFGTLSPSVWICFTRRAKLDSKSNGSGQENSFTQLALYIVVNGPPGILVTCFAPRLCLRRPERVLCKHFVTLDAQAEPGKVLFFVIRQ